MKFVILNIYLFISLVQLSFCWDLSFLGISSTYELLHVSLYYTKAFICIKSLNNTRIIETTWPEDLLPSPPKYFPSLQQFSQNYSNETNCSKILRAVSTDIDRKRQLWILDAGNKFCPSKVIVCSLHKGNKEFQIFTSDLGGIKSGNVKDIKLHPSNKNNIAFVTLNDGNNLLVFNSSNMEWREIQILTGDYFNKRKLHVNDVAFDKTNKVFMTDEEGNFAVAEFGDFNDETSNVYAKSLGKVLDRPKNLIVDPNGFLYCILPRYGAVIRWNPENLLTAEGYDILALRSKSIQQIIFGISGSVWIVHEKSQESTDHCARILLNYSRKTEIDEFEIYI